MKRIIVTGAVAAIAAVSFAGTTNAAPATPNENACFGQIHKAVNAGVLGVPNVGEFVKTLPEKGQSKKAIVNETYCP
jgi:hypothetical protein